jgi:hypothetical protein
MTTQSTEPEERRANDKPVMVLVTVNGQPVKLPDREVIGLEIKQAAIAQDAQLDLGFQLSVKQGNRYKVVGDTDPIRVHRGQEFLLVPPDDNS